MTTNTGESRPSLPFEWLTPGKALYYGYQFHVGRSASYEGDDRALGQRLSKEFASLSAGEVGTKDWIFLSGVQAVALSYGNGISRQRQAYDRRISLGAEVYQGDEKYMRLTRAMMTLIRVIAKYGALPFLGLLGIVIAKWIGTVVPDEVAEKTGQAIPTAMFSLFFIIVGALVSGWVSNYQQKRYEEKKDTRFYRLDEHYDYMRQQEYKRAWEDLSRLWEEYTGRKLSEHELPSYLHLMQSESNAQKRLYRLQRQLARSDLEVFLIDPIRRSAEIIRRRRGKIPEGKNDDADDFR